jgi:hypothetical protein
MYETVMAAWGPSSEKGSTGDRRNPLTVTFDILKALALLPVVVGSAITIGGVS